MDLLILFWQLWSLFLVIQQVQATHLSKRQGRTPPPNCLTVGQAGTHKNIKSALGALGSGTNRACIFIYPGNYPEQFTINYKGPLVIYGSTSNPGDYKANTVTISHTISSQDAGTLDKSSTVNIVSNNVKIYNINIKNGFGKGHQAVALTANAKDLGFYGCQFHGFQDTLYVKSGQQYYSKCFIEGAVDYIFGAASAWFSECTLSSNGAGAITASGRDNANDPGWYVFDRCKIIASPNPQTSIKENVMLGRPWRKFARVMYQYCSISDIVSKEGWGKMADGATPLYYEYSNTGPGSRTDGRKMESKSSGAIKIETVLGSSVRELVN